MMHDHDRWNTLLETLLRYEYRFEVKTMIRLTVFMLYASIDKNRMCFKFFRNAILLIFVLPVQMPLGTIIVEDAINMIGCGMSRMFFVGVLVECRFIGVCAIKLIYVLWNRVHSILIGSMAKI